MLWYTRVMTLKMLDVLPFSYGFLIPLLICILFSCDIFTYPVAYLVSLVSDYHHLLVLLLSHVYIYTLSVSFSSLSFPELMFVVRLLLFAQPPSVFIALLSSGLFNKRLQLYLCFQLLLQSMTHRAAGHSVFSLFPYTLTQ